jgi:hypothetical protein
LACVVSTVVTSSVDRVAPVDVGSDSVDSLASLASVACDDVVSGVVSTATAPSVVAGLDAAFLSSLFATAIPTPAATRAITPTSQIHNGA